MRLLVFEGPRAGGKSTVAQILRRQIKDSTLVNFTGFEDDGGKGLIKVTKYYAAWMELMETLKEDNQTMICDRLFFSEQIFSKITKSYSFQAPYEHLLKRLEDSGIEVHLFYMTIQNPKDVTDRSIRDKVKFKNVGDSLMEFRKQQKLYDRLFLELKEELPINFKFNEIDTSDKSPHEVAKIIMETI